MTYAVKSFTPAKSDAGQGRDNFTIWDTEEQAKAEAEKRLTNGDTSVSVWRQIATPRATLTINWDAPKRGEETES